MSILMPLLTPTSTGSLVPLAAILAFQAGQLKGEHDRLHGRSLRDKALAQLSRMGGARRP